MNTQQLAVLVRRRRFTYYLYKMKITRFSRSLIGKGNWHFIEAFVRFVFFVVGNRKARERDGKHAPKAI